MSIKVIGRRNLLLYCCSKYGHLGNLVYCGLSNKYPWRKYFFWGAPEARGMGPGPHLPAHVINSSLCVHVIARLFLGVRACARACMGVCVCVRVLMHVRAFVHACVRAFVRLSECPCVCACAQVRVQLFDYACDCLVCRRVCSLCARVRARVYLRVRPRARRGTLPGGGTLCPLYWGELVWFTRSCSTRGQPAGGDDVNS